MTLLTKNQILKADDRATDDVDVPEWGGIVRLMAMQSAERDAFEASMIDKKGSSSGKLANFRARFVARCIVDADGNRLFTDKDVIELGKKSAAPLSRLFESARGLNAMTEADVEEIEGN